MKNIEISKKETTPNPELDKKALFEDHQNQQSLELEKNKTLEAALKRNSIAQSWSQHFSVIARDKVEVGSSKSENFSIKISPNTHTERYSKVVKLQIGYVMNGRAVASDGFTEDQVIFAKNIADSLDNLVEAKIFPKLSSDLSELADAPRARIATVPRLAQVR